MKSMLSIAAALVLVVGLVVSTGATADEVTMAGKVVCAKCTLNKADAKECQDVFIDGRSNVEYYIESNQALKDAGHTCGGEVKATVTGTVSQKDGKAWIAATKITKG